MPGGYFPGSYFPPAYFPPTYFPGSGIAVPITFYPGLVEALAAFLAEDTTVTGAYPGAWWDTDAPRDAAMPFGVFEKTDTTRRNLLRGGYSTENVTIKFQSLSSSAKDAETAGRLLKSRLVALGSYVPTPFNIVDGREIIRFIAGQESMAIDPERGPLNVDVWNWQIPITWRLARGGET